MIKFKKKKSKKLNTKTKTILFIVLTLILSVILLMLLVNFSTQISYLYERQKAKATKRQEASADKYYNVEEIYPNEDDQGSGAGGSGASGLNLLLINDIKTEGYVKEYLTIAKKSEEGQLDDLPIHASVSSILGTQIAEGNTTAGGILPLTFLPTDSSGVPYWGKNPYGVEEKLFNLANADYNFYTDGGGKVPTSNISRNNSTGTYYGPFQQTASYFGMYGGSYPTAKMSPESKTSSRKSDPFYFPDQVVGLSYELSANANKYEGVLNLTPEQAATMLSVRHNAGSGAMTYQILFGVHWNSGTLKNIISEEANSVNLLFKDFEKAYNKNKAKLTRDISDHLWKFLALIMLLEEGDWYVDPYRQYSYITGSSNKGNITQAYKILHPELSDSEAYSKAQDLIKSKTKTFTAPHPTAYGRTSGTAASGGYTPIVYKIRQETTSNYKQADNIPIVHEIPIETAGHMFSTTYAGNYMYACMLKYAGIGIDPTNPDDYFNKLPEDEWKPGGSGQSIKNALQEAGFPTDIPNLTANRSKLLDYASQYVGNIYCYGGDGRTLGEDPEGDRIYLQGLRKDYGSNYGHYDHIDLNAHKGNRLFDCSSFIQSLYKEVLGINLPRTSGAQVTASNTTNISTAQRKPGDIGGNSAHVVMYIMDYNGGYLTIEAMGWQYGVVIHHRTTSYTWATVHGVD